MKKDKIMRDIVVLDTEYTTWPGALESDWKGKGQHREIVQIAAVRLDSDLREVAAFDRLVIPRINPILSDLFVELTGIDQRQLDANGTSFAIALLKLATFAEGCDIVCMNGDGKVMLENCDINGVTYPFARQFHRLRPLLAREGVDLTLHSSGDLHKLTPTPIGGRTHNALHDVRSMAVWLADARCRGVFRSVEQLPTDLPLRDPRSGAAASADRDAARAVLVAAGTSRGWFADAPADLDAIVDAMIARMKGLDQ